MFSHLEKGKSLSEFSTWGIGGPAKFFIQVDGEDLLCDVLRYFYLIFNFEASTSIGIHKSFLLSDFAENSHSASSFWEKDQIVYSMIKDLMDVLF